MTKCINFGAGITIKTDERTAHAYGVCRNHTDSVEFNRWLKALVARAEILMQSLDIEILIDFMLYFKFIEIPSGAGSNATEDRSKSSIFLKKSVIRIVNDDSSCFWHAMAVLLNENHPQYKHIKEGRNIRTATAQELCNRCNAEWNIPVSINQVENIEEC